MGKLVEKIKKDIKRALEAEGMYSTALDFQIEIAAGAALVYRKLLDDIENLDSPVVRDNEDMDYVAAPDEAVQLLPKAAKEYHNALVALGLAESFLDDSPKPGRPAKNAPSINDRDELDKLMAKTIGAGDDTGAI